MMPSADGVFTLSMHQQNNYPMRCRRRHWMYRWRMARMMHLEVWRTRCRPRLQASGRIAYVAGADPYVEDKPWWLTIEGLKERDRGSARRSQLVYRSSPYMQADMRCGWKTR